jgi:hypothetical protein
MPTESKTTQTPELETTGHFLDLDCSEENDLDEIFLDLDCSEEKHLDEIKTVMCNFRYAGCFLGFVVELTSFGAVTWIGLQSDETTTLDETVSQQVVHTLLWLLSHAALFMWPCIWMAPFLLSLTDTGTSNFRFILRLSPRRAFHLTCLFLTCNQSRLQTDGASVSRRTFG